MSSATILEFGASKKLTDLDFNNLEKHLTHRLTSVQTLPDLETLIKLINPFLRDRRFSTEEQGILKRLRQRAYDRRRYAKFPISRSEKAETKFTIAQSSVQKFPDEAATNIVSVTKADRKKTKGASMPHNVSETTDRIQPPPISFHQGVAQAFAEIDGHMFVKKAPQSIAWFSAAAIVSFFLWQQSLALYETSGFANPTHTAIGGIMMIVGFAAYQSITRSWIALLLCLYVGAYEGYLIVSGTIHNDKQMQASTVESNPELIFLQQRVDKDQAHYQELKQRYDNPESKVFKNEWFMKNHLNPAWDASTQAHEELIAKRVALTAASNDGHITWLKIFYRLGLVFLCMMLVHRFFMHCVGVGAKNSKRICDNP